MNNVFITTGIYSWTEKVSISFTNYKAFTNYFLSWAKTVEMFNEVTTKIRLELQNIGFGFTITLLQLNRKIQLAWLLCAIWFIHEWLSSESSLNKRFLSCPRALLRDMAFSTYMSSNMAVWTSNSPITL